MTYLNLAANKLTSLHPDSFEPYAMQDIRISIMIGRNPWHCDCDFKWVIDHATWDENAYDFFWEPQAEKGRFYEIIKGKILLICKKCLITINVKMCKMYFKC